MKKVLVICLILVALGMSCGGGGGESNGDSAAIRDTIEGFFSAYNARQYGKCLTYFIDYGDETEAQGQLAAVRQLTGEWTLGSIQNIQISGSTATALVTATIGGETETDPMELKKVGGQWKLVWESTEPSPDIDGDGESLDCMQGKIKYTEYEFTCEYREGVAPEAPYEMNIHFTIRNASQGNVDIASIVFRFYNQAGEKLGEFTEDTRSPWWQDQLAAGDEPGFMFNQFFAEEVIRYDVVVTDSQGREYACVGD